MVFHCNLEAVDGAPPQLTTAVSHDLLPSSHDQEGAGEGVQEAVPPPVTTIEELSQTRTLLLTASNSSSRHKVSCEPDDVPMAAFTQVSITRFPVNPRSSCVEDVYVQWSASVCTSKARV